MKLPHRPLIIVTILGLTLLASATQKRKSLPGHSQDVKMPELSSDELFDAGVDVLGALSDFYLASVEFDHDVKDADPTIQAMEHLLNEKKALQRGSFPLRKYQTNRNDAIKIAAKGSILGSEMIIKADDDVLQLLRTAGKGKKSEWDFRMAEAASARKEGYTLIAKSAPWVTVAMCRFVDEQKRHGAMPYLISAEHRRDLLQQLKTNFGAEIERDATTKDEHNSIVVAAMLMRRNLQYDTYEEARLQERQ